MVAAANTQCSARSSLTWNIVCKPKQFLVILDTLNPYTKYFVNKKMGKIPIFEMRLVTKFTV